MISYKIIFYIYLYKKGGNDAIERGTREAYEKGNLITRMRNNTQSFFFRSNSR